MTDPRAIVEDLETQAREIEAKIFELKADENLYQERLGTIEATIKGLIELYGSAAKADATTLVIPPGTFDTLTIAEAAEAALAMLGRAAAPRQLWDWLIEGGLTSTSNNPVNNLNTTLSMRSEIFERSPSGKGWRLKRWGGDSEPHDLR